MPRVNILKQVKVYRQWKLVAIPRDKHGRSNWKSLPEGRYFIEWRERGKRRRETAGITTADALEAARRRKHILEGRALGVQGYAAADEEAKRTPLHVAVNRYLELVEGLKKPNTLRKYKAVLNRFLNYGDSIIWFVQSKGTQRLWPQPPSRDTYACDILHDEAEEKSGDVRASAWFDHPIADRYYLHEHSLRAYAGHVLTLLWWQRENMLIDIDEYEERKDDPRSDGWRDRDA